MFTEEFVELLQKKKLTAYAVAKGTGISQGTMGDYATGKKKPSIQNIVRIADYLNVSVDFLLGRTIEEQKESASDNNVRDAIISKIRKLPDSQLDRLLGYLEALVQEQEEKK